MSQIYFDDQKISSLVKNSLSKAYKFSLMIKKFLLLFKTKWIFTLPKKRELLIYDKASLNSNFVKILFKKKNSKFYIPDMKVLIF